MSDHPMLHEHTRPIIATRPIERLGTAINLALEDGRRGLDNRGRSGDGKSRAGEYLRTHTSWLKSPTPMAAVTIPRLSSSSDNVIYRIVQNGMLNVNHKNSSALDRLNNVVNRIATECSIYESHQFIFFVDEAQYLSPSDFEYLANVDNRANEDGNHVLFVFLSQTDYEDGMSGKCAPKSFTPQVTRRFRMAKHQFKGLYGVGEVAHALSRYDLAEHEGRSFTEYFAPTAYAAGWRLESEAKKVIKSIEILRSRSNLQGEEDIPMAVLEVAIKRLLVNVAAGRVDFNEFSLDDVCAALERAGYVTLELVRSKQADA